MTSVKKRYVIGVPLLAAAIIVVVALWARQRMSQSLRESLRSELEARLQANALAMEIWMTNQERMVTVLANEPSVRQAAVSLLQSMADPPSEEGFRDRRPPPEQIALHQALDARLEQANYTAAALISTNLIMVGGARLPPPFIGRPVHELQTGFLREVMEKDLTAVLTPFKLREFQDRHFQNRGPPPPRGRDGAPPSRPPPWDERGGGPTNGLDNPARSQPGAWDGPRRERGPGRRRRRGGMEWTNQYSVVHMMLVAAPVRDDQGQVVGALSFALNSDEEFTKVLAATRSGDSGETFAFNAGGLLISQCRFDEQLKQIGLLDNNPETVSCLTLELRDPGVDLTGGEAPETATIGDWPMMAMVARAVEGDSGVSLEPMRDYRGVPVVGAWHWMPARQFGLVTKMDVQEAFQPLRIMRSMFLLLILLLALATLGFVSISYWSVVWRRRFNEAQLRARQLGQYRLERKIGEGGMGVVYQAHHALLRRDTAVKLLLPDRSDPGLIRQFEHEVRLTCQLSHPHTIQVYDYGHTPDGIFYYAMELLQGMNLDDLVKRHGAMTQARVVHLLKQVCGSLREAHGVGLIHRDIKPSNLFVCHRGGIPDFIKVLDFGLVRQISPRTGQGVPGKEAKRFVGTPLYMAPEMIRDVTSADPRSDVYALGATAYFLLTASHPFTGGNADEVYRQHLEAEPPTMTGQGAEPIDSDLETVIRRCLEKDPQDRPSTMEALEIALMQCRGVPVWTSGQAVQWWSQARPSSSAGSEPSDKKFKSSAVEETLRIDWEDREP